jgi:hypothetical protein
MHYTKDNRPWLPERYLAFVIVNGMLDVCMVDLGEANIIDRLIDSFRRSIKHEMEAYGNNPDTPMSQNSFYYGSELRKAVLDPLLTALNTVIPTEEATVQPFNIISK